MYGRIASIALLVAGLCAVATSPATARQDPDAQATIEALQTQVAELQNAASPTPASSPTAAQTTPASGASDATEVGEAASPDIKPVNLEIVLDVSGSMAQVLDTGETRMDAAKRVLNEVIAAVPDGGDIDVGLRIYGHLGDNSEAGAAVSCQGTDLVVPVEGVNKGALADELGELVPTGWTPIALSLERAGEDFASDSPDEINAIVLVTDGLETCGGDPAAVAAQLRQGPAAIQTNVIGFALTSEEQQILAGIAQGGEGKLLGAANAAELSSALFTVLEDLEIVAGNG